MSTNRGHCIRLCIMNAFVFLLHGGQERVLLTIVTILEQVFVFVYWFSRDDVSWNLQARISRLNN